MRTLPWQPRLPTTLPPPRKVSTFRAWFDVFNPVDVERHPLLGSALATQTFPFVFGAPDADTTMASAPLEKVSQTTNAAVLFCEASHGPLLLDEVSFLEETIRYLQLLHVGLSDGHTQL